MYLFKVLRVLILISCVATTLSFYSGVALASPSIRLPVRASNTFFSQAANACKPVISDKIYRFIEGIDTCVIPMTEQEISKDLNDPFAQNILRKHEPLPKSVNDIVAVVDSSISDFQKVSYMVGEGSQIPLSVSPREDPRNLRYAITWGPSKDDARIFLSASPGGNSSFHQVIAWDNQAKQYNYYQLISQRNIQDNVKVWSWAGSSRFARNSQTVGKGCFDCHHNGVVIMKELKAPWNNWQSQLATISPLVVPSEVAQESLFKNLTGAEVLEGSIRGGFQRYYSEWLRGRYQRSGGEIHLSNVNEMLRHLIINTTINLESTAIQSDGQQTSPANRDIDGIPNNFLLWDDVLNTLLDIGYTIPKIKFNRKDYDAYLNQQKFSLIQTSSGAPLGEVPNDSILYQKGGSTYFAFFVPIPSLEDTYMTTQLKNARIVTDKFIASLLMVDFKNPVFSEKRAELQKYANQITSGTIKNNISSVPDEFAQLVKQGDNQPVCSADIFDSCSAEQQFLYIWNLPDNQWKATTKQLIQQYLDDLKQLSVDEQLDQLMQLSVKRRTQFQSDDWKPISNLNEFSLLLPYLNGQH